MPDFPKFQRRPLKIDLDDPAEQMARLLKSMDRIADGLEGILELADAVTVENADGQLRVRVVMK